MAFAVHPPFHDVFSRSISHRDVLRTPCVVPGIVGTLAWADSLRRRVVEVVAVGHVFAVSDTGFVEAIVGLDRIAALFFAFGVGQLDHLIA